jgi:hypothetical protein
MTLGMTRDGAEEDERPTDAAALLLLVALSDYAQNLAVRH